MKDRKRYYTTLDNTDDNAIKVVITKAIEIAQINSNYCRIVFLIRTLKSYFWLEPMYSKDIIKKLKGNTDICLPNTTIPATLNCLKNYNPIEGDIVISLGLLSDEILLIEDNFEISAIIALPPSWTYVNIEKWTRITDSKNLNNDIEKQLYSCPPCLVVRALSSLSKTINMSTGIRNSSDNELAKTYIRALKKSNISLQPLEIEAYLFNKLNWEKKNIDDFIKLITIVNNGGWFKGGRKTGLSSYLKKWENECNDSNKT